MPTEETAPFWDAARRGEFLIQECRSCGFRQLPPAACCNRCLSRDLGWTRASGRGTVYSYAVYHRAFHPAFADMVPYVVADIELEEGVFYLSNVVGCAPEDVYIGMPVEVAFERVTEEITLPVFRPRQGQG
jgi:uncharacterized OB-fold protein